MISDEIVTDTSNPLRKIAVRFFKRPRVFNSSTFIQARKEHRNTSSVKEDIFNVSRDQCDTFSMDHPSSNMDLCEKMKSDKDKTLINKRKSLGTEMSDGLSTYKRLFREFMGSKSSVFQ